MILCVGASKFLIGDYLGESKYDCFGVWSILVFVSLISGVPGFLENLKYYLWIWVIDFWEQGMKPTPTKIQKFFSCMEPKDAYKRGTTSIIFSQQIIND